ncbi:MAG: hypothetical protein ACR2HV_11340 [Acidimicrobiales bacterium]
MAADLAKAELAMLGNSLAPGLARFADPDLHRLLDQVPELVALDPSLAWCLPRQIPPEVERLRAATDDVDLDAVKQALPAAVAALDGPVGRARLAHAVLGLRDTRRIRPELAAAAVVDLASGSPQLVTASIVEAVRVDGGAQSGSANLMLSRLTS